MLLKYGISLIFAFVNRAYKNSDFYTVHYWKNTEMCRSKVKCNPCRIADLLPKHRSAQNLTPLYSFGAILGGFFRYERLCFSGGILYRQPFKSRCLSLPGNKKRRIATALLSCSEKNIMLRSKIIFYLSTTGNCLHQFPKNMFLRHPLILHNQ